MIAVEEFGNPLVKSFRKKYIRRIAVGDSSVLVHNEIFDIVSAIVNGVEGNGGKLPSPRLLGYRPPEADEGPSYWNMGLAIQLVEGMEYESWGFEPLGDNAIAFTGTSEWAKQLSEMAEEMRVMGAVSQEPTYPDHRWQKVRPGARVLQRGDCGDDVMFMQLLMDSPDKDGVFGEVTEQFVMFNQSRFGLVQSGVVDDYLWKTLLPRASRFSLSRGDSGLAVRVLQAALVAYGWNDDLVLTSRFDVWTDKTVRRVQYDYGLRVTGRVGGPEWVALIGKPLDNPN